MSSPGFVQLSTRINTGDAISPSDARADMILGILWAGTLYAIGMIWTMLSLIDRWRGPLGTGNINFMSVIAAVILSVPWPAVLILITVM